MSFSHIVLVLANIVVTTTMSSRVVCCLHRVDKMIEITAKLPRRSVFIAGETIECVVTVANVMHSGQHHKGNGSVGASTGSVSQS